MKAPRTKGPTFAFLRMESPKKVVRITWYRDAAGQLQSITKAHRPTLAELARLKESPYHETTPDQ